MAKISSIKTYAEQGLEDIQSEIPEVDTNETELKSNTANEPWSDEGLESVSGSEPIFAYYQLKTPQKPGKTQVLIFQQGVPIKGTYLRTISREAKSRDGRKFTSYTHLVKSAADGKTYGLSGPGLGSTKEGVHRGFNKLIEGSRVSVTYLGRREGKDGTMYENFAILGDKLRS